MPNIGKNFVELDQVSPGQLDGLSDQQFTAMFQEILTFEQADRQENQLLYYKPASASAESVHYSKARIIGVGGGNRSAKTETILVEELALATGVFPSLLKDELDDKFRGPINVRLCIESLTTTMHPIIVPKLQWWKWTGIDQPGGERGHWGWVPKYCLKDGSWEKSWSEKLRTLTVLCHDPENPAKVLGESIIQIMSYDQDPSDFASGTFHIVHHDEPPTYAIWSENASRTLDVNGRTFLTMTWPDDPAIPVDWIFDEVYEPGMPGPRRDENVEWFELDTLENIHLDAAGVLEQTRGWSEMRKTVKLKGQPIRFSNRIHPLFTDAKSWWSYDADQTIVPVDGKCPISGTVNFVEYNHVLDFDPDPNWPSVWLLDPHPRKDHMGLWVMVDPSDDYWVIDEFSIPDDPTAVKEYCDVVETNLKLSVGLRLMDPNMGASPASAKRNITWQDEFAESGLDCDLADVSDVGRKRLNEYLKPCSYRLQPRIHFHSRTVRTQAQLKRYVWDEHKRGLEKDLKQKPREKNDDFPTLLKYLLNYEPTFQFLRQGAPVKGRTGSRRGAR